MQFDSSITTSEMAQKTGIKFRTLQRHISQLQAMGVVVRKDGRKDGYWEVVKNKQFSDTMPAIITDTFDYDDIVRVLDLDEAFVQHQVDARTLNELIRIPYQFIAMQYGQNSYISILR